MTRIIATYQDFLFSLIFWSTLATIGRVIRDWKKRLFALLVLAGLITLLALLFLVYDRLGSSPLDIGGMIGTVIGDFSGWYAIGGSLSDYLRR